MSLPHDSLVDLPSVIISPDHPPTLPPSATATTSAPPALPPLPPRRPSSARHDGEEHDKGGPTTEVLPSMRGVGVVGVTFPTPPSLPPRRTDAAQGDISGSSVEGGGLNEIGVGNLEIVDGASLPPVAPLPLSATTIRDSAPPPPPLPPRLRPPIPISTATATPTPTSYFSALEPPPIPLLVITPLLLSLAYARVNLFTLALVCAGSWWLWAEMRRSSRERMENKLEMPKDEMEVGKRGRDEEKRQKESVEWMNHVLKTLWPVLSTDILTPFIDLLEDAMISQVPPIISSVRLTSPSLGNESFIIDSMRIMSDSEWFEHLSAAPSAPTNTIFDKLNFFSHKKSSSSTTEGTPSRSSSTKSTRASRDEKHREREVVDRQRRDTALLKVGGRRGQGAGAVENGGDHSPNERSNHTVNDDPSGQSTNTGHRGFEDNRDLEGEGQFVNFAVDFSFDGRENVKAWSLHFICYMGFGLKGVGGAELPVWIDLLQARGTVFIRLQLSSSPPFVQTGTVTMPFLPSFDISAKPLKGFDVMNLPLTKTYMMKSIREVADTFVRPKSYTLDLDRLLLGREASLRTNAIGVLQIRIHRCQNLRSTDTLGTSDPYATVSFSKYDRPLFSTRTIVNSLNPRWEEDAFVLVDSDHVANGEHLIIRVYDSDRFSSDDTLGQVDIDLLKLVEKSADDSSSLRRQTNTLRAAHTGMKVEGTLDWSWGFFPIRKMPSLSEEKVEINKEEVAAEKTGTNTGREGDAEEPGLLYKLMRGMAPEPFAWEHDRRQRRMESLAWLTGQRARESMEASLPPTEDYRSGVLNFHIHQATEVRMEEGHGTFHRSHHSKSGNGAIGGRPAIDDSLDTPAWDTKRPPSAYCEVILNGRLVFRTRTKQLSPAPYWNASSERFIRDWTKGRLVIVVRDEKDREHDPVIGLVAFKLSALFKSSCQVTRTYPLQRGLGSGHIRLSFLFKAVDLQLPPNISGFELATVEVLRLSTPASFIGGANMKDLAVQLQTDVDGVTVEHADGLNGHTRSSSQVSMASMSSKKPRPSRHGSSSSLDLGNSSEAREWWASTPPPRTLAVQYRHSCSLLLKFVNKPGKLKKDHTLGMSVVHLTDIVDDERVKLRVPVFETEDVNMAWERALDWREAKKRGQVNSSQSMITITLLLRPGVARVHRRLAKRDKRLMHVYEAWRLAQDVGGEWDLKDERRRGRNVRHIVREQAGVDGDSGEVVGLDETDTSSGDARRSSTSRGAVGSTPLRREPSGSSASFADTLATSASSSFATSQRQGSVRGERLLDDEEEHALQGTEGTVDGEASFYRKWRDHSKALHRQNKGVMQYKLARTGRLLKEAVQAKVLQTSDRATHGMGLEVRHRGGPKEMEIEGQSRL